MSRGSLANAALARFVWRDGLAGQIVNTDIDGLLTAALLWETKRVPVVGFYDTVHLWLTEEGARLVRDEPGRVVWSDVDMCWPGLLCVSQHVVAVERGDNGHPVFAAQVNPNVLLGVSTGASYTGKYPYGAFQWLAAIAGVCGPDPADRVATGLAWIADGGADSAQGRWAPNCRNWATVLLPNSMMAPLWHAGRVAEAPALVREAEAYLRGGLPGFGRWSKQQYRMCSAGERPTVHADPSLPGPQDEVNTILERAAKAFGWDAAQVPESLLRFDGRWHTADRPPVGWLSSADVVSAAATFKNTWCWTEAVPAAARPGSAGTLADVLP